MHSHLVRPYVETLHRVITQATVTDAAGDTVPLELAARRMGDEMHAAHERGNCIFFVGNGGSSGICSHMATDYCKNGGMRATAFNDAAALTCLGNDFGYEHVFAKQVEWHAKSRDILVAISSSGQSANILNAVRAGRKKDCIIFTLSGFKPTNPLRSLGDLNIYLDSAEYGFVEVGHLTLLHNILDIQLGWRPPEEVASATAQEDRMK